MNSSDKLTILMIDDEVTSRMLAKEFLEEAGHTLRQSEDGKHGLKLAMKVEPDVILLDLLLPSIDGYSLCRTLKKAPETAHVPVILITAAREPDVIEKGFEAGADDFVTKPVDWAFLSDRVVNVWRKSRERMELRQQSAASVAAAPQPGGPIAEDQFSIDDLMADMDPFADQFEFVRAAISEQLEDDFAAKLERAVGEVRSAAEKRIAEVENSVAHRIEAAVAKERARLEAEIATAVEQAVVQARAAERQSSKSRIEALQAELASLKGRGRADLENARTEASRAAEAAERYRDECARLHADIGSLRETARRLETERDEVLLAAGNCEDDAGEMRVRAAWSLVSGWLTARGEMIAAIRSRLQGQLQNSASAARTEEIERALHGLQRDFGKFKIVADAMLADAGEAREPVSISEILGSLSPVARKLAAMRKVKVGFRSQDDGLELLTDAKQLRYCLLNLIMNAIRSAPPGGSVNVHAGRWPDGRVFLATDDNGVGIAPGKLKDLMECLERPCSVGSDAPGKSDGLGIPSVLAIARTLGCELTIDSRLGAGTSAKLIFPAEAAGDPRAQPAHRFAG